MAALLIFALVVMAAPLAFGAVDRPVQIALLGLLALGIAIRPLPSLEGRGKWVLVTAATLLVVTQFGPWASNTQWRAILGLEHGVDFPWSRHPEPMRAVDGILAIIAGVIWLGWVRGLAAARSTREKMFWILLAAGLAVAIVCFAAKGVESGKIYGIRSTPGWIGWGPFPNRNHTASFLSMAALVTLGVMAWTGSRKQLGWAAFAGVAFSIVFAALLLSKSRGGLVAFGAGMAVFIFGALARSRSLQTRLLVLGIAAVSAALLMVFGGSVLSRFTSKEAGLVSNDLRRQIWSDTIKMWSDAPLLGHGIGVFPEVFPLYTQHDFDGQLVRHPESSWLLWLSETGGIVLTVAILGGLWFAAKGIRRAWQAERRAFYLTVGALAGVAAIVAHAAIDVPAHRWGTAFYALALLGVALPAAEGSKGGRGMFLLPVLIAGFWSVPFLTWAPWAPVTIVRLEARESAERSFVPVSKVPRAEWEAVVGYFPIDPIARHYAGLALLSTPKADPAIAERDLSIARRLSGSSWGYAMMQARAYGRRFPSYAIAAWQDSILRAGRRSHEILRGAIAETAGYPGFWPLWGQFLESHPEYLLAGARAISDAIPAQRAQAKVFFDLWHEQRPVAKPVSEQEAADLYSVVRWCADAGFLRKWVEEHPERAAEDYRTWARLLSEWGDSRAAWDVYARVIRDPALGDPPKDSRIEALEGQYRALPENPHLALAIAQHYEKRNESARAMDLILIHAQRPDAPAWFIRKGAHILASRSQYAEAVALALKEK